MVEESLGCSVKIVNSIDLIPVDSIFTNPGISLLQDGIWLTAGIARNLNPETLILKYVTTATTTYLGDLYIRHMYNIEISPKLTPSKRGKHVLFYTSALSWGEIAE